MLSASMTRPYFVSQLARHRRPGCSPGSRRRPGSPTTVAAAFAGELATRLARRTLWMLPLTGSLVGIWRFLLFAPAPLIPQLGNPDRGNTGATADRRSHRNRNYRHGNDGLAHPLAPRGSTERALSAAVAVAIACILSDLTMLSILAFRGAIVSVESSVALAVIAIAASAIRLVGSMWLVRRCLRARTALVSAN